MKDPETPASPPRVLVADDQADIRAALQLLLKTEGFKVHLVDSPAAVLAALESQDFDVLLMDLNYTRDTTTGREGLDLLARIDKLNPTLPVVAMTAWGSIDLAVEVMRRGVRDFVQKPWDNSKLVATLRYQIQQGRQVRLAKRFEVCRDRIGREVQDASGLADLLGNVAEILRETLQNEFVTILARGTDDRAFRVRAGAGEALQVDGWLDISPFRRYMATAGSASGLSPHLFPSEENLRLFDERCALVVPVKLNDQPVGFIGLGFKSEADDLDLEEINLVAQAADQISAGIDRMLWSHMELELEEAREMQQRLLPKDIPQLPGFSLAGCWHPARAVGGDYFDVFRIAEDTIAFCIGDVAGKGMPAALLMSSLQAAVKAFGLAGTEPRELCEKVNRVIHSCIAPNKFITFTYCLLESASGRLTCANAGHIPPMLIRRSGECLRLDTGGALLGVFPEWTYEQRKIDLQPGDRVLVCTDGVTEARNQAGEEFGEDRLIRLLIDHRDLDAAALQDRIMESVLAFGGRDFEDDATAIVLSVAATDRAR